MRMHGRNNCDVQWCAYTEALLIVGAQGWYRPFDTYSKVKLGRDEYVIETSTSAGNEIFKFCSDHGGIMY